MLQFLHIQHPEADSPDIWSNVPIYEKYTDLEGVVLLIYSAILSHGYGFDDSKNGFKSSLDWGIYNDIVSIH
jgi:hypothetical protein